MYDHNDKKYIQVMLSNETALKVRSTQSKISLKNPNIINPLDGNILTIKVPFRYRRVTCSFDGVPVQTLKRNDTVQIVTEFMGGWNVGDYSGFSWKLGYIKLLDAFIT
tara:strand:+ start:472 stop:795 length:324 start_codon:yes stop_codon:yes gene_type:complete